MFKKSFTAFAAGSILLFGVTAFAAETDTSSTGQAGGDKQQHMTEHQAQHQGDGTTMDSENMEHGQGMDSAGKKGEGSGKGTGSGKKMSGGKDTSAGKDMSGSKDMSSGKEMGSGHGMSHGKGM